MKIDTLNKIAYGMASQETKEHNKDKWHNSKGWRSKRDTQRRAGEITVGLIGISAVFGGIARLWHHMSRRYGRGYAFLLMTFGFVSFCCLWQGLSQWFQFGIFTITMFGPAVVVLILCLIVSFLKSEKAAFMRKSVLLKIVVHLMTVLGFVIAFIGVVSTLSKNIVE